MPVPPSRPLLEGSSSRDHAGSPSTPPTSQPSPMICFAIRLRPGQELKSALADFTSAHSIQAGFILSCVGSVKDVSLRLAGAERPSLPSSASQACAVDHSQGQQQQQNQQEEEQHMLHTGAEARFEVLSLVGTLSPKGLHLHASLGDERGAVCGGHLVRATVHTTAEIVVGVARSLAFSREMDSATGFKELVVSRSPAIDRYWERYWCAFFVSMVIGVIILVSLGSLVNSKTAIVSKTHT